jgi:hypothetical protein
MSGNLRRQTMTPEPRATLENSPRRSSKTCSGCTPNPVRLWLTPSRAVEPSSTLPNAWVGVFGPATDVHPRQLCQSTNTTLPADGPSPPRQKQISFF